MEYMIHLFDQVTRKVDILTTDLDGEIGMFNIETGKYYTLGGVSSDIWNFIEKPISVEQLVNKLLEQYDIDKETCLQHTITFLIELQEMKLIDISIRR
jgi:hypothetical protein